MLVDTGASISSVFNSKRLKVDESTGVMITGVGGQIKSLGRAKLILRTKFKDEFEHKFHILLQGVANKQMESLEWIFCKNFQVWLIVTP